MKRLSGTDALFLSTETPAWHQHIGGLIVVDPSESERFSFDEVRRTLLERIPRVPKFRWKLKEVPLHLDRAVWIDDKDFNIDKHFRRIAVPSPGGRREVGDLVGTLMGYQLDRRRPLWEMWYVEGVAGGQVALIIKFHHCLMDGASGIGLAEQIFDLEPNPGPIDVVPIEEDAGMYEPSDLELFGRSLIPTLQTPRKLFQYMVNTAGRGMTIIQQRNQNPISLGAAGPCFNGIVGPHRQSSFASVSIDDVRAVKDACGVKINDVVLALVSGALRAHMARHGDAPASGSLAAQVPVSTRLADDEDQTNKVATMSASLATDVDDPIERLKAIHASTQSAKELTDAIRARADPVGRRGRAPAAPQPRVASGVGDEHHRPRAPRGQRHRVQRPRPAVPDLRVRRPGVGHLRRQRAARVRRPQRNALQLHRPGRLRADVRP